MGKLVRRSVKTDVLLVGRNIQLGTWDSPKALGIASVKAIQAVHSVFIAGTSEAIFGGVKGSITSGNLNLIGLHGKTTVLTAKNIGTGYMYGAYIEQEVLGTGTIAGLMEGIRIEQYIESTTTLTGAIIYGIHIANYINKDTMTSYYFCRFSEDAASTVDAIFLITRGASCLNINYIFELSSGAAVNAWTTTGTLSTMAGYLKCKVNNLDRYIPLYSS